jgi:hypothetical protein
VESIEDADFPQVIRSDVGRGDDGRVLQLEVNRAFDRPEGEGLGGKEERVAL